MNNDELDVGDSGAIYLYNKKGEIIL